MYICKPTCKCKLLLKPIPKKIAASSKSSETVALEHESRTESEQIPHFDTTSGSYVTNKSRHDLKDEISIEQSIYKEEHEELPDLDGLLGHKLRMPSTILKTEEYLRMHRINELVHYLMVKIISHIPDKPLPFLINLIDHCMLFRAGHISAPVIFEKGHLEAVINSFDPAKRGWLSICQVRRIYWTLKLNFYGYSGEKFTTDEVLSKIEKQQEKELLELLSAGLDTIETPEVGSSDASE